MCFHMNPQRLFGGNRLLALRALEWLFFGVCSDMTLQRGLGGKGLKAVRTFVGTNVDLEELLPSKSGRTFGAFIRARAGMTQHMVS